MVDPEEAPSATVHRPGQAQLLGLDVSTHPLFTTSPEPSSRQSRALSCLIHTPRRDQHPTAQNIHHDSYLHDHRACFPHRVLHPLIRDARRPVNQFEQSSNQPPARILSATLFKLVPELHGLSSSIYSEWAHLSKTYNLPISHTMRTAD